MPGRQGAAATGRRWRSLLLVLSVALVADGVLWSAHVLWRNRALEGLDPLLAQIDSLAEGIAADDAWISKNQRLLQGYGQHEELSRRVTERGRRARAYSALVEVYNRRVETLYRRFYLAPVPAPRPPLLQPELPRNEGNFPTP